MPDQDAQASDRQTPPARAQRDQTRARIDHVLFARLARGDRHARDALIERFLPLARSIARRYETSSGESLDDLDQVAALGLVKALDRYDPTRGVPFASYAVPTITGELKRHLRDRTWAIRPPRDVQQLALRVDAATRELTTRVPTIAELADAMHSSDEEILEALQARRSRATVSLNRPARLGDDPGSVLQDTLASIENGYACAEDRIELRRLLRLVSPRVRLVLRLRYQCDLTQAEIGELLGVSQLHVSRIIRAAISQLNDIATYQHERAAERSPVSDKTEEPDLARPRVVRTDERGLRATGTFADTFGRVIVRGTPAVVVVEAPPSDPASA
jgi:RNA polymerase sigma-B factor